MDDKHISGESLKEQLIEEQHSFHTPDSKDDDKPKHKSDLNSNLDKANAVPESDTVLSSTVAETLVNVDIVNVSPNTSQPLNGKDINKVKENKSQNESKEDVNDSVGSTTNPVPKSDINVLNAMKAMMKEESQHPVPKTDIAFKKQVIGLTEINQLLLDVLDKCIKDNNRNVNKMENNLNALIKVASELHISNVRIDRKYELKIPFNDIIQLYEAYDIPVPISINTIMATKNKYLKNIKSNERKADQSHVKDAEKVSTGSTSHSSDGQWTSGINPVPKSETKGKGKGKGPLVTHSKEIKDVTDQKQDMPDKDKRP